MDRIDYPSEKVDSKKFEKNNLAIAINVLYATYDKIYPAYVSKYKNVKMRKEQVILLMIPNKEK